MTLRHPHVFGKNKAKNLAEVWTNWEKIKKQEKLAKRKSSGTGSKAKGFSYFDFPKNLPALLIANNRIGCSSFVNLPNT